MSCHYETTNLVNCPVHSANFNSFIYWTSPRTGSHSHNNCVKIIIIKNNNSISKAQAAVELVGIGQVKQKVLSRDLKTVCKNLSRTVFGTEFQMVMQYNETATDEVNIDVWLDNIG